MKHRKRQRPRITKAKEAAGFQNPRIRQIDDQSGVSNGLSEGIAALSIQEDVAAATGIVSTVLPTKNSFDVLANCGSPIPFGPKTSTQEVLESLFNPKPEANSMNRRNVVKEHIPGKGDDYQNHKNTKTQHSDFMKSIVQDTTAHASGRQECALDLSESSSHDPWYIGFKNVIPMHLCCQKVKYGLEILMDHLVFAADVGDVHAYRVITGCESHGLGRSTDLKHAIVGLLETHDIEWEEENYSTLLIKLDGWTKRVEPF